MNYPGAASIECGDCHLWHYDLETGEIKTIGRDKRKIKRDGPPPCRKCPKGSPENAKFLELHPANVRLIHFYKMVQTAGQIPEPFTNDPLTLELLTIVKDLQMEHDGRKAHEREQALERKIQEAMTKRS